jgi:hypothetical protein
MNYLAHTLVPIVPFTALAIVSIALLLRHRTLTTALMALGFCSVALSHITGALVGFYAYDGRGDFVNAMDRYAWTLPVTYGGIVGGLWIGSLSLLWHTLVQTPPRA